MKTVFIVLIVSLKSLAANRNRGPVKSPPPGPFAVGLAV